MSRAELTEAASDLAKAKEVLVDLLAYVNDVDQTDNALTLFAAEAITLIVHAGNAVAAAQKVTP